MFLSKEKSNTFYMQYNCIQPIVVSGTAVAIVSGVAWRKIRMPAY
jgi:hypothetical protein